ncbi:MAG: hypothetical protein ABIO04_12945, partial [Ferruginibacter sp.]
MKKYFLFVTLVPCLAIAQNAQTGAPKKAIIKTVKPADGYLIMGNIKGFTDGTTVSLLNGSNGTPEATSQIVNEKFTLTGKSEIADFKV